MTGLFDVFSTPDPARCLQRLYYPEILRELQQSCLHDKFLRYKLKHDAYEYASNIFTLFYDQLMKDEKKLINWAPLHYGPDYRHHADYAEFGLYRKIMNRGGRVPCINPETGADHLTADQFAKIKDYYRIIVVNYPDGLFYVLREHHEHDRNMARDLKSINSYLYEAPKGPLDLPPINAKLSASQLAVITHARDHPLTFCTGGAGTGKTTIIIEIIQRFLQWASEQAPTSSDESDQTDDERIATAFATFLSKLYINCPTYMAIENIRERLTQIFDPEVVKTINIMVIHKIAYSKGHELHPTDAVMIFEECSMYDGILGAIIAKNIGNLNRCKYIFIGDPNQLPPVSRHSVFRLMLNQWRSHRIELRENFRSGDVIIQNSNVLLHTAAGKIARLTVAPNSYQIYAYDQSSSIDWLRPLKGDQTDLNQVMYITYRNADVLRINHAVRDHWHTHMPKPERYYPELKGFVSDEPDDEPDGIGRRDLTEEESSVTNIVGIDIIVSAIPDDPADYRIHPIIHEGRPFGVWEWRIGDRCRSRINDSLGRIFNGSIAQVVGFGSANDSGLIYVRYKAEIIGIAYGDLWPAYCITIHNSQGQEWKHVVFCEMSGDPLKQSLAYVAMTRAKKQQSVIRIISDAEIQLTTDFIMEDPDNCTDEHDSVRA